MCPYLYNNVLMGEGLIWPRPGIEVLKLANILAYMGKSLEIIMSHHKEALLFNSLLNMNQKSADFRHVSE